MPLIAITGVPGTGKSSLGRHLSEAGETVIDINATVIEYDFILGRDEERDSLDVDINGLTGFVLALEGKDSRNIFLEGHVSHLLPVDKVVVLRCRPEVLKTRLEERGWSGEKVRENLEAEAMAVITQEAVEAGLDSYEIDVTDIKVEDIAGIVQGILQGAGLEEHRPGKIDFFEEIMKWY